MFSPVLGAHTSGAEIQYHDNSWMELCGQMASLVAKSGDNKGKFAPLVEAICRDFRQHDEEKEKNNITLLPNNMPLSSNKGRLLVRITGAKNIKEYWKKLQTVSEHFGHGAKTGGF